MPERVVPQKQKVADVPVTSTLLQSGPPEVYQFIARFGWFNGLPEESQVAELFAFDDYDNLLAADIRLVIPGSHADLGLNFIYAEIAPERVRAEFYVYEYVEPVEVKPLWKRFMDRVLGMFDL